MKRQRHEPKLSIDSRYPSDPNCWNFVIELVVWLKGLTGIVPTKFYLWRCDWIHWNDVIEIREIRELDQNVGML